MALAACPRCKKIFDKARSAVCSRCQDSEDDDFDKIRAVLDRNPNLNAEQVAEEASVSVDCVMRMLAEGLISNVNLTEQIKCGRCGGPGGTMSNGGNAADAGRATAISRLGLSHHGQMCDGEQDACRPHQHEGRPPAEGRVEGTAQQR